MPSIQVKDVPADAHRVLRRRAVEAGQSLQEYLRCELVDQARRPTLNEVFDRIGHRDGGALSLQEATATVRADRDAG